MNSLSRLKNATPPIFTGLLLACLPIAPIAHAGKSAFVWNYLEAFAQLTLKESAVNIAAPFFLVPPL
jgi:hypothetical protein